MDDAARAPDLVAAGALLAGDLARHRRECTLEEGVERGELALGAAELRVHSATRRNVQLVPADADPFVRRMAARVYVRVEGETEGRFRLAPGRYALVGHAGARLREVDVPAAGLALELE